MPLNSVTSYARELRYWYLRLALCVCPVLTRPYGAGGSKTYFPFKPRDFVTRVHSAQLPDGQPRVTRVTLQSEKRAASAFLLLLFPLSSFHRLLLSDQSALR